MYLMMDKEISCKGHCDSFSHFLYLVSYSDQGGFNHGHRYFQEDREPSLKYARRGCYI